MSRNIRLLDLKMIRVFWKIHQGCLTRLEENLLFLKLRDYQIRGKLALLKDLKVEKLDLIAQLE